MIYRGFFSLLYSANTRRDYVVEFFVEQFQSPGGLLRRIAYEKFEAEEAVGLSIETLEPINSKGMYTEKLSPSVKTKIIEKDASDSQWLRELELMY